jgi:hypothetical protein
MANNSTRTSAAEAFLSVILATVIILIIIFKL